MSEPTPEIACENCVAACCRAGMRLWLADAEHKVHGPTMNLETIIKPRQYAQRLTYTTGDRPASDVPPGYGVFEFVTDCTNLKDDGRCGIYSRRPQCCRDFEVGSKGCLNARRDAGLDDGLPDEAYDMTPPTPESESDRLIADFFADPPAADAAAPNAILSVTEPLSLDGVRRVVAAEGEWIAARLAECDAKAWLRRTRCAGWTVGDLAAHLVTGQQFGAGILEAKIIAANAADEQQFEGDRMAVVDGFVAAHRHVCDALARLAPTMVRETAKIGQHQEVDMQYVLQVMTTELAVHSLDLADAFDETRHLSPEATQAVANALPDLLEPGVDPRKGTAYLLRSSAFEIPLTWSGGEWRTEAAPNPCVIEGEPEAILLYAFGRVPFKRSHLTTNHPDQARAFRRHIAGP